MARAKRGTTRSKKVEPEKEAPKPEDKPKATPAKPKRPRKRARKARAKTRVLTNPDTGNKFVMQPYDEYPEEFKQVAKLMYISGQANLREIANKIGIPYETVRTWKHRDKWVYLKREVGRLASRDAVKTARRAMSRYVIDIDRGMNTLMGTLNTRLENVDDDKKLDNEAIILKYILEVWKMKIALVRTLTYGVHGKAFTPHPTNMSFDDTDEPEVRAGVMDNAMEEIVKAIPPYLREAAKMVMGVNPEDMDPDVLDAVSRHIELQKKQDDKKDNESVDLILFEEEENGD